MTRIDRRALFTSGAAAALLAATGASLEAAPRRGGHLRLAVPRPDGGILPAARAAVFETLTEIGPDGVLTGGLATGWQATMGGRVWDITLRDGVAFHDASAFGPRDVVASLEPFGRVGESRIVLAEQIGTHRVRLELDQGNPQLPYLLADAEYVMRSARQGRQADSIGTGLYRSQRWTPGRGFLGQRVASHYKDGQAGWIDSIEIIVIPDARVRAEALRDGFVDVAELPQPADLTARSAFRFHPSADNMAIAMHKSVGAPRVISSRNPLDDGRIAERWWMV